MTLLYVLPVLTLNNQADSGATNTELFSERGVALSVISALSDFSHFLGGELGCTNLLTFNDGLRMSFRSVFTASGFAASAVHVADIVGLCALSKVRGIDAGHIVAGM